MSDRQRRVSPEAEAELTKYREDLELLIIHDAEGHALSNGRHVIEASDIATATKKWQKPSDRLSRLIRIGEIVILALFIAQLGIYTQLVSVSASYMYALYSIWVIELAWLIVFQHFLRLTSSLDSKRFNFSDYLVVIVANIGKSINSGIMIIAEM